MQIEAAIGFCLRAGKCAVGTTGSSIALKKGKAKLIVLDGSATTNTRDMWRNACAFYHCPMVILPKELLPRLTGGAKVLAVTDTSFADLIHKNIE